MLFYKKRNMLCYNIICGIMKKRNRKDKIFMVLDRENKFIGFLEGSDKNSVKTRLKELKNDMRGFQDITFMYLIIEWRGG